jgi:hypothetical protein
LLLVTESRFANMAAKKILLVEGKDDVHVFRALFGQRRLPHLTEIKEHEGYGPLLEAIPVRLIESEVQAVGIVLDADTDLAGRWEAVRCRLVAAGYATAPTVPDSQGLVMQPPADSLLPRVGAWLMPNNQLPGILEDFLRFLVPAGDPLFAYASQTVNGIPARLRLFNSVDTPKALIHTWLAWQAEPGRPLGTSITAGFLNHATPEVDALVAWLRRLFFP